MLYLHCVSFCGSWLLGLLFGCKICVALFTPEGFYRTFCCKTMISVVVYATSDAALLVITSVFSERTCCAQSVRRLRIAVPCPDSLRSLLLYCLASNKLKLTTFLFLQTIAINVTFRHTVLLSVLQKMNHRSLVFVHFSSIPDQSSSSSLWSETDTFRPETLAWRFMTGLPDDPLKAVVALPYLWLHHIF